MKRTQMPEKVRVSGTSQVYLTLYQRRRRDMVSQTGSDWTSHHAHATDHRPLTIPALKKWNDGNTTYTFGPNTRILVRTSALEEVGQVFSEDVLSLTGLTIAVLQETQAQDGDIVLELGNTDLPDGILGDQGYRLDISAQITVSARTTDGVFYGTRTLLQLLKQGFVINGGVARDWPQYPQRSLMVDVGRQYFSVSWLESHIRDLAYLKYNYFHLHFSDNFGFRLQSERHPEIVSEQHYTKKDISQLEALARKYHITIVPEIDIPGHLDAALSSHPELRLVTQTSERLPGDLDLTNDAALTFVRDLLEECLPLFSGPYWHLGADEYLLRHFMQGGTYDDFPQIAATARARYGAQANAKDLYLGFINWAHQIVKAHGKTTRIWSDGQEGGSAVSPSTDAIIYEHWIVWGPSPFEIIERGIPIVNCNFRYLYYAVGAPSALSMTANAQELYETFEPHHF